MAPDIDDVEARVRALLDDADDLVAVVETGESDAAQYVLAVVHRPHPDEAGQVIVMERYAQLAADWSDMSDTFLTNGINRRSAEGDGSMARALAESYAALAAQMDGDTVGDRDVVHKEA